MNNVIDITTAVRGIPTPRFQTQRVKQNHDPDLFVKMLANHPGHIQRRQTRRDQYYEEARRQAEAEKQDREEQESLLMTMGTISVFSMLGLLLTTGLLL